MPEDTITLRVEQRHGDKIVAGEYYISLKWYDRMSAGTKSLVLDNEVERLRKAVANPNFRQPR